MERHDIQRRHYDRIAQAAVQSAVQSDSLVAYGSASVPFTVVTPYRFVEDWIAQQNLSGLRYLDYGCGLGAQSIFPAIQGAHVVGVDISPESLRVANSRAKENAVGDGCAFIACNGEELPLRDASFDVIFSCGSLFCFELDVAYRELARVVKPNGHVLILDTLGHNPILNANRRAKLRRGTKVEWSVNHILKLPDFERARLFFDEVEFHFFDLATLPIALAYEKFGERGASRAVLERSMEWAAKIDQRLLKSRHLQKYAFKVVSILRGPRSRNSGTIDRG